MRDPRIVWGVIFMDGPILRCWAGSSVKRLRLNGKPFTLQTQDGPLNYTCHRSPFCNLTRDLQKSGGMDFAQTHELVMMFEDWVADKLTRARDLQEGGQ